VQRQKLAPAAQRTGRLTNELRIARATHALLFRSLASELERHAAPRIHEAYLVTDDVIAVLREIAQLLRQRIDQTTEMAKRAEERFARMPDSRAFVRPDFAALEAKHEAQATAHREEAAQRRAEDVAFRERALAALEDQNALIRQLLDRAT
jgi:hypothetical protein